MTSSSDYQRFRRPLMVAEVDVDERDMSAVPE